VSDHIGRSFDRHPLEDTCPCPQEPCGLIDVARIDPTCPQHALHHGQTIRQAHTAERCPVTAPTPPKLPSERDLTVSKDLGTTLDSETPSATFPPALVETAAEAVRVAQGVPFVGPKQQRIGRAVLAAVAGPIRAAALRDAAEDWHQPHDPSTWPASEWLFDRANTPVAPNTPEES
jgi:hypothetical protein